MILNFDFLNILFIYKYQTVIYGKAFGMLMTWNSRYDHEHINV